MSRPAIPQAVIDELRSEVNFGCPIPNCGNPYLEWHHFDPPYRISSGHDPKSMIAICSHHHPMADVGTWTVEQLRSYKSNPNSRDWIEATFGWRREKLVFYLGGIFYYDTPTIIQINNTSVIYISRDSDNNLLINVKGKNIKIQNSAWAISTKSLSVDCTPGGKFLSAEHENGERFSIRFHDVSSHSEVERILPAWKRDYDVGFPFLLVESTYETPGKLFSFGQSNNSKITKIGSMVMTGGFFGPSEVAIYASFKNRIIIINQGVWKNKTMFLQYE